MTKAELSAVKELRRKLEMKDCGFGTFSSKTEEVRELTRLWRESWIFPILDNLIQKYDHRLNNQGEKPKGYNSITKSYKW